MDLQTDWKILNAVLDHGPATTTQVLERTGCSQSGVQKAVQRMTKMGVLMLAGRGPRKPGSVTGSTPYVIDVGPRIRLWAIRNVKPARIDE